MPFAGAAGAAGAGALGAAGTGGLTCPAESRLVVRPATHIMNVHLSTVRPV
jgi:hypothetical protein